MRKSSFSRFAFLAITLITLLSITFGIALAAATTKTLSTNFTLVNMSETNDASVNVTYLKDQLNNGDIWDALDTNEVFDIPKNYGQVQIRQYFDTTMTPGSGSAVVSSSEELNAVAQIFARGQTPTQGAYSGFTSGSGKFYVPLVAKKAGTASGEANSQVIIQNVEEVTTNTLIDVTVDLVNFDGSIAYSKPIDDLEAGVSYYYDLSTEASLPASWMGSAVVSSVGGNVVVVSNFFQGDHAMQTFNAFSLESLTSKWVVPLFFVRLGNGLSTTVTIQNLSGDTIPAEGITLTCTKNPNSPDPAEFTAKLPVAVGDNAQYGFNPVVDTTLFPVSGWYGSCRVDAGSANVAVMVQMRYVNSPYGLIGAGAYEAIPEGGTNTKMIVPLVAKRLSNGFATVVVIQNMDYVNDATVDLIYTPAIECPLAYCDKNGDDVIDDLDKYTIEDVAIVKGGSIQRNHRLASGAEAETVLPDGWSGSLLVISNYPLSGVVQMTNFLTTAGDTFMVHDAFTQGVTQ